MAAGADHVANGHSGLRREVTEPQQALLSVLLRRSAQGDERAFAALFDVTAPTIYGLILGTLDGSVDLAVEVAERVFVEIWRTCGRHDQDAPLKWMLIIADRHAHQASPDPAR